MNTVGIVILSILGGMFALALVVAIIVLIWIALELRRGLERMRTELAGFKAESDKVFAQYQADLRSSIDSAKASFASIRGEMSRSLEESGRQTRATLEEHQVIMQRAIDKINAEALAVSAAKSIDASLRMEKVINVFQRFVLDNIERTGSEYGPDEYAPEEARFGGPPSGFGLGPSARLDAEADRETEELIVSQAGTE